MGMVIYIRPTADQVVVVHLALSGIMSEGSKARTGVLIRLLRQVRKIASRVRGVTRIRLPYVERASLLTTGTGGNVLPFNATAMEAVPLGESRSCLVA